MKCVSLISVLFLFSIRALCQTHSIDEVIKFSSLPQEELSEILIKKGWDNHNFEMKPDSNFNRRTWMIQNAYNDLKSYVIHYEYADNVAESYIIYQFSDRATFKSYITSLKEKGFKKLNVKSKERKKNKRDKNIHNEISETYYSEKNNSILIIKDVFFYGMNTFIVYSYKYNSAIGKSIKNNR